MKTVLLLLAAAPLMMSLVACETLTETPGENRNRMLYTVDTNAKQIPSDVERLLLLERPTYLTDAPIPNRY